MSGCLALDDGIPDLTSRLLLLLEDEDDLIAAHKSQKNLARTTAGIHPAMTLLEETQESEAMVVSPCSSNNDIRGSGIVSGSNHHTHNMEQKTRQHPPRQEHRSSPLWSSPLPRFDTIPECSLPSIPLPPPSNPATPLSTTRKGMGSAGGLYASFSSTPVAQDLWQYKGEETHKTNKTNHHHHPSPSFLSPRTTDAVYGDSRRSMRTIDAVWGGPPQADNSKPPCNLPPMAPSLSLLPEYIPQHESSTPRSHHPDGPPSVICCYRTRSNSCSGSSLGSSIGFDDDEVSLLADDPDEDDAGVLPPATYDVVVNILDEIDNSNE